MRTERNPIRTTQAGVRTFENNSGSDCTEFGILKADDIVFTPTDNANYWNIRQIFDGNTPTDDCIFGIAQTPIKNTKSGPVMLSGVTPCTINVSDENHGYAIAGTSVDKLESASSGPAQILWKESGTGDKNAVVRLSNSATSVENLSDMFLDDLTTYDSADSGWNLLPMFFRNPTQSLGSETSPNFAWSSVFDSRKAAYPGDNNPLGLQCESAGTYYGVFHFEIVTEKTSLQDIKIGEVLNAVTVSATDVWETPSTPDSMTIVRRDGIKAEIDLLITSVENTSHSTSFKKVGHASILQQPQLFISGHNDEETLNLVVPFYFSVASDDAPFEIQPWVNIDTTSPYFQNIATKLTFKNSDSYYHQSWIRYIADQTHYDTDKFVVTPP
jgi:hypothetical protein